MFGWINRPDDVKREMESLPVPICTIGDVDIPSHIYGWKAYEGVFPMWNQGDLGSCVGFGSGKAGMIRYCIEIKSGSGEKYVEFCQETNYIGSRVYIGQNQIQGDGSLGIWAAKWLNQYGLCPRGIYSIDLSEYNAARIRAIQSRELPNDVLTVCKKHPIKTVSQVNNWLDCKKVLATGGTVFVCSMQGFSSTRNEYGVAAATNEKWPHCMAIIGYHEECAFIDNSWGKNFFRGPIGPGDGPLTGFYAEANVVNDMLAMGDSWALYDIEGIKSENLTFLF